MKSKKLFLLALASAFGWSVSAQDSYGSSSAWSFDRCEIGVKIAPAVSWLSTDAENASGNGSAMKFNWGAVVKYNLTDNYALVSGFNVNGLGGDLKYAKSGVTFRSENKFHAFEIPAAFRLTTDPFFDDFCFFAQMGLGFNYVFNPEIKETIASANEDFDLPAPLESKKVINRFVLAYNLAIGAEYQFTERMALTAHLLYNNSLTNLLDSDKYRVNGDPINGRYNFIELGIGVLFR